VKYLRFWVCLVYQGGHELAQAAFERLEQRLTPGPPVRLCGARGRTPLVRLPYLASSSTKRRQHAGHAEQVRVAAVDPGEQRLGKVVNRFVSIVFCDEPGHRLIRRGAPPGLRNHSIPIRSLVRQPSRDVAASGQILVGIMSINPSGSRTGGRSCGHR